MKILIAEDDVVTSALLQSDLKEWGYTPVAAANGADAWKILRERNRPELALVDWMMPSLSGPELCQRVRELNQPVPVYIILLTGKTSKDDIVQGLQAGAQDYVTKPHDSCELRARIDVGRRMVELQTLLSKRVVELESANQQIKQLHNLLPMCCRCKKVRDDSGYWSAVENYLQDHSGAKITQGLCPECYGAALGELQLALKGNPPAAAA